MFLHMFSVLGKKKVNKFISAFHPIICMFQGICLNFLYFFKPFSSQNVLFKFLLSLVFSIHFSAASKTYNNKPIAH